jgi:hypothetical protein
MRVDTSDYPYPLEKMRGTWDFEEAPDGGLISMRVDYWFRYGPLRALLILPTLRAAFFCSHRCARGCWTTESGRCWSGGRFSARDEDLEGARAVHALDAVELDV